ncbi:MAG: hypothetical protein P8008_04375, partial [Gammaproteobacteria bacterium]
NSPVKLVEYGSGAPVGAVLQRTPVAGSMFRVAVPQLQTVSRFSDRERLALFLIGCLLLAYGIVRLSQDRRAARAAAPPDDLPLPPTQPDPEAVAPAPEQGPAPARVAPPKKPTPGIGDLPSPPPLPTITGRKDRGQDAAYPAFPEEGTLPNYDEQDEKTDDSEEKKDGAVALEDLPHELQQREEHQRQHPATPEVGSVELSSGIFRAYDIRGVVGSTLDAGVARQIGKAVGSVVLDAGAGPVVVGRDGRHSGPGLVAGLVEGLRSTGCDVIDVGAVPTGALYYAVHEFGNGSGVMVTGSHNPPDYNGFKIMVGGAPLSGDEIHGLYDRIRSGDLRSGEGGLEERRVLEAYRDRIAGDIQLQRPLKVVADCGNGIGGSIAAEVLRAIGAEVIPLFDEVDGDFPNHHPDPSEPENLQDLIESVRLTEADIGVAFDGDADRLGVVTPSGDIVFPDRVMMLYVREILGRKPGETIIYDVKCTGHLERVIREAGGKPEMFKTGHSLIKKRMKEVHAPFAGEMSGHFFFEDRWYGFDCGIYSAARLLEILARDERPPQEVLDELPNSVSTPELKVHLEEGENHSFIEAFQAQASFEGARISTIDGLRADFDHGWGLVRASNTTPVLVLRFDADDEEALKRVQEAFREQLLAVRSDLELPF